MLKEYTGAKDEDNKKLKAEIKALRERLMAQQQLVRESKLPIIVLLEGWAAAGKGSLINAKLDIVRNYMQDSFGIDIDVLRATVLRRQQDVFDGQVDLHSVVIK